MPRAVLPLMAHHYLPSEIEACKQQIKSNPALYVGRKKWKYP